MLLFISIGKTSQYGGVPYTKIYIYKNTQRNTVQNVIIINCVGFEENKSQGLQYVNLGELYTVKPTFIRM